MRRRSSVESILIDKGECAPTKVSVNSWITLQPGKHGEHARDARKHKKEGGYKAKILRFRMKEGSRTITEILVQHVYTPRQLHLEPGVHNGACNYLYLSNSEDWVDPKSVLDVLCVIHAEIGEAQKGPQSHRELLQIGYFFYNAQYFPPTTSNGYGRLQHLSLPSFEDPEWPIPDMMTSEAYRARLRSDIQFAIKPNVGSKLTHVNWFLPIHVMVDLFAYAAMHRTPTFFVFKNLAEDNFDSLMDVGWDVKICIGADIIKCIVDRATVIFRYHIGRSTLYMNFQYNRQRLVRGSQWEFLEQVHHHEMVKILCEVKDREELLELEVGSNWTLASLRQEIIIALGSEAEDGFAMCITEGGVIREKLSKYWNTIDIKVPEYWNTTSLMKADNTQSGKDLQYVCNSKPLRHRSNLRSFNNSDVSWLRF